MQRTSYKDMHGIFEDGGKLQPSTNLGLFPAVGRKADILNIDFCSCPEVNVRQKGNVRQMHRKTRGHSVRLEYVCRGLWAVTAVLLSGTDIVALLDVGQQGDQCFLKSRFVRVHA